MNELLPGDSSRDAAASQSSDSAHTDISRRSVQYLERPEYFGPNTGTRKSLRSGELDKVTDPQLRCALRIADIMQALDFPQPPFGPVGGVTAIQRRVPGVAFGRFSTIEIEDTFPEDILQQLYEKGMVADS